jgi:hypothetical protein
MKLKFELVNGYGVLVDKEAEIKEGEWAIEMYNGESKTIQPLKFHDENGNTWYVRRMNMNCSKNDPEAHKIIFAEKELGIDVLVFDWRDFEVEKLANEKYNDPLVFSNGNIKKLGFKEGYKSNPAKYTEEDIERAFIVGLNCSQEISLKGLPTDEGLDYQYKKLNQFIQSLQKHPKYVVMEDYCTYGDDCPSKGAYDKQHLCNVEYKLFTNSEGKQQGTVKELIWE